MAEWYLGSAIGIYLILLIGAGLYTLIENRYKTHE